MYSRKPRIRLWPLVMAAVMVLGSLVGVVLAKYVYSTELHATVTFSARLADNFWLQEHQVLRQEDGSYVLDTGVTVAENNYILMPGVDVPKDPFIKIKNKTPLESYLFVEVVDSLDVFTGSGGGESIKPVTYAMTNDWRLLKDGEGNPVAGENKGAVYVYTGGGETAVAIHANTWPYEEKREEETVDGKTVEVLNRYHTIPLLETDAKGNSVFVSQYLNKYDVTDPDEDILEFYAALGEIAVVTEGNVTRERTPAEVYWDVYHNPDINT